jgi:hypothetical protein
MAGIAARLPPAAEKTLHRAQFAPSFRPMIERTARIG